MEEEEEQLGPVIINDFWPRWSVKAINEIQFNLNEGKKNVSKKTLSDADKPPPFTDKEVCILPIRYQETVYCWKRPLEIFEDAPKESGKKNIILYADKSEELRRANLHLKQSSYYTNIIDAFNALMLYKNWTTADFNGFGFSKWKPTNHIYTGGKVQLGAPHIATINDYGKYAIRLFHCGAWRQIIIDDRIPVNINNQILMPCIRTESTLELWPLLITKALLKLNFCRTEDGEFYIDQRHTPQCKMYDGDYCNCKTFVPNKDQYLHEEKSLNRTNVIYALTGWFPFEKDLSGYYVSDAWALFSSKLKQYQIPEKDKEKAGKAGKGGKTEKAGKAKKADKLEKAEISEKTEKAEKAGKAEKGGKEGKGEKTKESKNTPAVEVKVEKPRSFPLVMMNIALPPRSIIRNTKLGFIDLLCSQYRSTPLFENIKPEEDLAVWKTFRWAYWAMEKNIWKPFDPTIYWSIFCTFPTILMPNFQELLESEWAVYLENINSNVENESPKKSKPAKSNKGKKADKPEPIKKEPPAPTEHWILFNKLIPYLQNVQEYPKTYSFEKKFSFTDEAIIEEVTSPKKDKRSKSGPEPKGKKAQKGAVQEIDEKFDYIVDNTTELFLFTDQENEDAFFADFSVVRTCPTEDKSTALDKFLWYCSKQKTLWTLKTDNFASLKMRLPKGRSVYRLRFNASMFYLRLYTNAPLRVAYFSDLLDMMNSESVCLTKYVEGLSNTFLDVIGALGSKKFPEKIQAFFRALLKHFDENYGSNEWVRHFMYDKFLQLVVQFLEVLGDKEAKIAFQRLFILADFSKSHDPSLKYSKDCKDMMKEYNELKDCLCDCAEQGEPFYTEKLIHYIEVCAAVIIQSFMKGDYVRRLKRFHSIKNTQYFQNLKTSLQKFHDKYFVKEPILMHDFVRKFVFTSFEDFQYNHTLETPIPETNQFGNYYEFRKDFGNTLHILKYEGTIDKASGWIPLRIGCFYCHSDTRQKYIFHASTKGATNVKIFTKIIRCDNLAEIPPTNMPYLYKMSKEAAAGYHVAVYLYAPESVSGISWMLQVGFPRYVPPGHFCDLCGLGKCHCPDDTKVNRLLENYALSCETTDMSEFEIFRSEDVLFENDAVFVCQYQIFCGENCLIFWFFSYKGEEALNFKILLTKQGGAWPVVKRTFLNQIDFFKSLNAALYTLTILYETPIRSKKPVGLGSRSSKDGVTFGETSDVQTLSIEEYEVESDHSPKEMGPWCLTIAYQKGIDVVVS